MLPFEVLAALESNNSFSWEIVIAKKGARAKVRFLTAAALRDILNLDEREIAVQLEYEIDEVEHERDIERSRAARAAVEKGRGLWAKLGAWPWWCSRPPGTLPSDWWHEAEVAKALHAWHHPTVPLSRVTV